MIEKPIPSNPVAEATIIAMVLDKPELLHLITGLITTDDFHTEKYRVIYEVILTLHEKKRLIDFITVTEEFMLRGKSEEDHRTLSTVMQEMSGYYSTYRDQKILECARILRDVSLCRDAIKQFTHLVSLAWEQDPALISIALETIKALELRSTVGSQAFSPLGEIAGPYLERVSDAYQLQGKLSGVNTGFHDINRLTNGLQNSDLIVFAGRPGDGKTTFSLCLADNATKHGYHVGYFSMEMNKWQLFNKLVAMGAPIDSQRLIRGTFDDDDWSKIVTATEQLTQRRLSICDRSGLSIEELCSLAQTLHANEPVDLFVVDYLQLMRAHVNGKRIEHREREITEITQGLKNLARRLNRPVIALAQLSRAVESRQSKIPQLSDLRESGSIENEADIVGFLFREEKVNPETDRKNITDIIFAKHRNGAVGEISLYFDRATSRFLDLMVTPPAE